MRARSMSFRLRRGVIIIALALAALAGPTSAFALDTSTRSAEEIRQRWSELRPAHTGAAYLTVPHTSAPYAAGTLQQGFLQDGLNSINYARYLAGLPDDVVLDADLTDLAQHGAVLGKIGQVGVEDDVIRQAGEVARVVDRVQAILKEALLQGASGVGGRGVRHRQIRRAR